MNANDPQLCDERNWETKCFRLDEYTKKNECLKCPTMPAYSKTAVSGSLLIFPECTSHKSLFLQSP